MKNFQVVVLEIVSKIEAISEDKKSIIQADMLDISDDIEQALFDLRVDENNIYDKEALELKERDISLKAGIGLLFLSYVVLFVHKELSYKTTWSVIAKDLQKYKTITTFFKDHYFTKQNQPTNFLIDCMEEASYRFGLRHAFEHKDEGDQYKRNTILLQMGLLNKFQKLNLWLSGYINQKTLNVLLNKDDEFYSSSFHHGWRVLRRYRDNIIDESKSKVLLNQNSWFAKLDLDEILKAAKSKLNNNFLQSEHSDSIFYLDKVLYQDNILKFIIKAEDLYSLELGGSEYSVYVDEIYKGKIFRNEHKVLELDREIIVKDSSAFKSTLCLKNEDDEIVYNDDITLFDLSKQILLFDEDGKIYKNFLNKLPSNKHYSILFDSDLDCDVHPQVEYFDGYATLISNLSINNNCNISYNDKTIFSLNFTKFITKPEWIDQLVLFTKSDEVIKIGEPIEFQLKCFDYENERLYTIPKGADIVRWTNSSSFVDEDEIEEFSASLLLSPDIVYDRRHSFFIRYENQTYHRVVSSFLHNNSNKYYFLYQPKDGENIQLAERKDVLNHDQLIDASFQVSYFDLIHNDKSRFIKDKTNLYSKVVLNKKQQFSKLPKFGETIVIADSEFYDEGIKLCKVVQRGIVKECKENFKIITLAEKPPFIKECEFIVLDSDYKIYSLDKSQYTIGVNTIIFNDSYLVIAIQFAGNYIGSYVQHEKIDFMKIPNDENILKFLYFAYMPLLLTKREEQKEWIQNNILTFFKSYMSDTYTTPQGNKVYFNFDEVSSALEHLVFDIEFTKENAHNIFREVIAQGWAEKLLKMPILLCYLLTLVENDRYVIYFLDLVGEPNVPEDRDEDFINKLIDDLLYRHDIGSQSKQTLKIAMHYKYGNFYLAKALKRIGK